MKIEDFRFGFGEEVCVLDSTFFEENEMFSGSPRSYRFQVSEVIVEAYQIEKDIRFYIDTDGSFYSESEIFANEAEAFEEFKKRAVGFGMTGEEHKNKL